MCRLLALSDFFKKSEKSKEPDIFIADKELGLINFKILDIEADEIESASYDNWKFKSMYQRNFSPHHLAEDQLYAIKGLYESNRDLRMIKGRISLILPYVKKSEWEDKGFNETNDKIIFSDELGENTLLNKAKALEPIFGQEDLNDARWKELLVILSGQNTFREDSEAEKNITTKNGVKAIIKDDIHDVDMQQKK